MIDREKLERGLDCCSARPTDCDICHYNGHQNADGADYPDCKEKLMIDALALLKEKEDKPVLDEFGQCFLNAIKRQLDYKLQMIEMLISPEFAEKIVELMEKMFD